MNKAIVWPIVLWLAINVAFLAVVGLLVFLEGRRRLPRRARRRLELLP